MKAWRIVAALASVALAACHGGAAVLPASNGGAPAIGGALGARATLNVRVTLLVPKRGVDPAYFTGAFYPVWLSHASPVATFSEAVASGSASCKGTGMPRTCSFVVKVPGGGPYDAELALTKSAAPGSKPIGAGFVPIAVKPGSTLNATTLATVSRVGIALQKTSTPEILSTTTPAIVTGYDNAGNAIVSNAFASASGKLAIALAADRTSAPAIAFSRTSIATPALGGVTIAYNSTKPASAQFANGFTATISAKPSSASIATALATLKLLPPAFRLSKPLPGSNPSPHDIIAGKDGQLYFGNYNVGSVGRMTTALVLTKLFNGFDHPQQFVAGTDGNVYVTSSGGNSSIGRITPAGVVTIFPLATNTYPFGLAAGPNNELWFGSSFDNYVGYVSTSGTVGPQYPLPSAHSNPAYVTRGSDGNFYYTLTGIGSVAQVTPAGAIGWVKKLPGTKPAPEAIVLGPDHNLWVADTQLYQPTDRAVLSISTAGAIKRYSVGTLSPGGYLAFGPDGKVWFTAYDQIGRLDPATGSVISFAIPKPAYAPGGFTLGPDNAFYITFPDSPAYIGRMQ